MFGIGTNNNKSNYRVFAIQLKIQLSVRVIWAWKHSGHAIVGKPLSPNGSILFCTTAGHIMKIRPKRNEVDWLYRIPAEIWSDPLSINRCIAFGARDSQLHVIDIPTKTGK